MTCSGTEIPQTAITAFPVSVLLLLWPACLENYLPNELAEDSCECHVTCLPVAQGSHLFLLGKKNVLMEPGITVTS